MDSQNPNFKETKTSMEPGFGIKGLTARSLNKRWGQRQVLKNVSIEIQRGEAVGLLGPNGAGKTTTMRIIATLLNPTWGEAYVCGHSIYTKPKEIRRLVGYMPDFFGVYDDMKVIEYFWNEFCWNHCLNQPFTRDVNYPAEDIIN